jgi:hypothetical protein
MLHLRSASTNVLLQTGWGWGSPDNRRKADDSCQALCVGGSVSSFFHDRQLVQRFALSETAARMVFALRGDWPGICCVGRVEGDPERSEMQSRLAKTAEINS